MSLICFEAILARPVEGGDWLFLRLPQPASDQLPARSMCSVEGTMQGQPVATTLLPDGEGGHWMKVDPDLIASLGLAKGQTVSLKIAPVKVEPEPKVPAEIAAALADASPLAQETWASITPMARRDWIFWIVSAKKAETRAKRLEVALSKLSAGNRRPCCFDRTGMYDKSLSCPVAEA